MSSLQKISPEPIPEAIEEALLAKLYTKMYNSAVLLVKSVRAIQEKYGDEGVEVIHNAFKEVATDDPLPFTLYSDSPFWNGPAL